MVVMCDVCGVARRRGEVRIDLDGDFGTALYGQQPGLELLLAFFPYVGTLHRPP